MSAYDVTKCIFLRPLWGTKFQGKPTIDTAGLNACDNSSLKAQRSWPSKDDSVPVLLIPAATEIPH